jgi:Flp pilus assembly protein TadG
MRTVKTRSREAGVVLIIVLLSLVVLCGFMGLAVDAGLMFRTRRTIQTAVDSAAIAGALETTYPGDPATGCTNNSGTATGAVCAASLADAASNGVAPGNGTKVWVDRPPLYGPFAGNNNYVEVISTLPIPTTFMGLLGFNSMPVQARATAYIGAGASQGCVYALNPTVPDAIYVNDSAGSLTTPNCAIYSDSGDLTSSMATKSAHATISGKFVGMVGGYSGNVTEGNNQPPVTSMAPVADPLGWVTPPPVPTSGCNTAKSGALAPGYYCNGITGSATLSPGLYFLDGAGLNLGGNSTVTCPTCTAAPNTAGTGVTLYFMNNTGVSLGGTSSLSIVAASCTLVPTTTNPPLCTSSNGAYNGIALWGSGGSLTTGGFQLQGNKSGFNITGIFYFPKSFINLQGNSCSSSLYAAIVAQTVQFVGCTILYGYPLDSGTFPLKAAALVE